MKEQNGSVSEMEDNYNREIEFVDEKEEMLAEQFVAKFKSLSLSGQLLLEMKKKPMKKLNSKSDE